MIYVEDLHKYFGDLQVLKGIDQHIAKGEKVAVIGPSGSGKSTFLRCLNLLETPTQGRITVDGEEITGRGMDINKIRQKMGRVFQQFNLCPHKTVMGNITMAPMTLKKLSKAEAETKAEELLRRVGLLEKADAYPAQLSGGQKQRLSIARALVKKPEILILDDSLSALDFATDAKLRKAVHNLEGNTTTFLVSQRIAGIRQADQILVLGNGTLEGNGTHDELMKTCEVYREIYFSQFPEERAAYNNESGVIA